MRLSFALGPIESAQFRAIWYHLRAKHPTDYLTKTSVLKLALDTTCDHLGLDLEPSPNPKSASEARIGRNGNLFDTP